MDLFVLCPSCQQKAQLEEVLTAQSNQNVIYICPSCQYTVRDIETKKG